MQRHLLSHSIPLPCIIFHRNRSLLHNLIRHKSPVSELLRLLLLIPTIDSNQITTHEILAHHIRYVYIFHTLISLVCMSFEILYSMYGVWYDHNYNNYHVRYYWYIDCESGLGYADCYECLFVDILVFVVLLQRVL
jgi:hypothetical protein